MKKNDVSAEEFYDFVRRSFEGNNQVYKVEAVFYDGQKPIRMVFDTPEGFIADQRLRAGTLEIKTDE